MEKTHTTTFARFILLCTLIANTPLWAMRIAPEQPLHFADLSIATYYQLCNTRYVKAIAYHQYEGLVRHMIDYRCKKDLLTDVRDLENEIFCLRKHIRHVIDKCNCTAHVKALLQEHGLDEYLADSLPPSPRHR